jgi:UDP-N-acetylglucosamine:LPS N-acetylglucosamine transferase
MKICLVSSSGGHLIQLYALRPWWQKHKRFWVTFKKEDAVSILNDEKTYWAHFPTNRNMKNFVRNLFLAYRILRKERPDIIISTGAGVSVPFFWLGKLFGSRLIYMEVFDRIDSPTLTGKLVYHFTDKFLIQWESQKVFYPKGEYWGQAL